MGKGKDPYLVKQREPRCRDVGGKNTGARIYTRKPARDRKRETEIDRERERERERERDKVP